METSEQQPRKRGIFGIMFRGAAALGIGLMMSAIWWEYSARITSRLLGLIGL